MYWIYWHVLGHNLVMYWACTGPCTVTCTVTCTGMYWHVLACTGMYWPCTDMYWVVLGWHVLGMYWGGGMYYY